MNTANPGWVGEGAAILKDVESRGSLTKAKLTPRPNLNLAMWQLLTNKYFHSSVFTLRKKETIPQNKSTLFHTIFPYSINRSGLVPE